MNYGRGRIHPCVGDRPSLLQDDEVHRVQAQVHDGLVLSSRFPRSRTWHWWNGVLTLWHCFCDTFTNLNVQASNLDKSLDEIISTKRKQTPRPRRSSGPRQSSLSRGKGAKAAAVGSAAAAAAAVSQANRQQPPLVIPGRGPQGQGSKVIVSNLPTDVTEAQVKELFSTTIGPLRRVLMSYRANGQSTGVVTVQFQRAEDASRAYSQYNNRLIDGSTYLLLDLHMQSVRSRLRSWSTRPTPLSWHPRRPSRPKVRGPSATRRPSAVAKPAPPSRWKTWTLRWKVCARLAYLRLLQAGELRGPADAGRAECGVGSFLMQVCISNDGRALSRSKVWRVSSMSHGATDDGMHAPLMLAQTSPSLGDSPWGAWPSATEREQERRERAGARLRSLVESVHACPSNDADTMLAVAHEVHKLLWENGSHQARVYEGFGDCGGFLAIGKLIAAVQRGREEPSASRGTELLLLTLAILTDAISHSPSNLLAFEHSLGWDALVLSLNAAVSMPDRVVALLFGMSIGHVAEGVHQFRAVSHATGSVPPWHRSVIHPQALFRAVCLAEDACAPPVARTAYVLLHDLLCDNVRNAVVLSRTPLLSRVLRTWLRGSADEQRVLRLLLLDGMKSAADVRTVFQHLLEAPSLHKECARLELLHHVAVSVHRPAALVLPAHDTHPATVHISALHRPFPPDASSGFTLALAVELHHMASQGTLDLVHVGPEGTAMRLSLQLEDRSLVYSPGHATSYALPRTQLATHTPQHIVLTHARSAPHVASTVHVYVNGQRACTLQAPWPGALPHPAPVSLGSTSPGSVWSLSSAFLHDQVVPSSIPQLLYELMPVYTGHLQGPLARFLTYPSMAHLQARLDALGDASSPPSQAYASLHAAMYTAAAHVFPSFGFYFHLQAAHTVRVDGKVLVPNEATEMSSGGHCIVHGVPTVRVPRALGDAVWGIGGCAVLLALIERADSSEALEHTLRLFLRLVTHSWRLAEDAERSHAYGVLGVLLRMHAPMLTPQIVSLLENAVVVDDQLVNIPLYRAILMDVSLWIRAPLDVQLAYMHHFARVLPLGSRRLRDVHLIRRLVHGARAAPFVPVDVINHIASLALHHYFRPRNIQATVHFITLVLGHTAPSAHTLGATGPRTDADTAYPPTACSMALVPRCAMPDARALSMARTWLDVLVRIMADDARRAAMVADLVHPKWLLMLVRPGLARDDVPLVLEFVGMLLSTSPSLAQNWTRLGGFRVLERTLPPHWDVPCVLPWMWTLLLGPHAPKSSLYHTFAHATAVAHPQALRVIVQCMAHGMMACRTAPAKRRASLPHIPAPPPGLTALEDSVRLLVVHSHNEDVRALLMLAPTLVAVLRATAPCFVDEPCGPRVCALCDALVDMLAACIAELVLSSHTLTLLHNLHAVAMPTSDPLIQSRLCTAVYIPLLARIDSLIRTRPVMRHTLELVADMLEMASNESLRSLLLQLRIFDLAQVIVYAPAALVSFKTRMQTTLALERNVLHSFATDEPSTTLSFCYEARLFLLTDASDLGFIQCVAHHATKHRTRHPQAQSCLLYMSAHWPDLVKDPLADTPPPFGAVWASTLASQQTFLRSLARDRIKTWRCEPSSLALSTLQLHARIGAWHTALRDNDSVRSARQAQDTREDIAFMRRQWADMRDSLRLPSPDVSSMDWHLDPTEGPSRARIKLWSVPHRVMQTHVSMPVAPDVHIHVSEQDAVPLPEHIDLDAMPVVDTRPSSGHTAPNVASPSPAHMAIAPPDDLSDKIRCILRTLEPGDSVKEILNTSRVVGIDVQSSLLIAGAQHLYLLDDYFQRPNGEIVNVWEAPPHERDALIVAAGVAQVAQSSTPVQIWRWEQLRLCLDRAWLHRQTALELFFHDGQSCLLVLPTQAHMTCLKDMVRAKAPSALSDSEALVDGVREMTTAPARLKGVMLRRSPVGRETLAWQERRMSNAEYLMALNTVAGRTMNDLTQFPVFPWILADYTSMTLDLTHPESFRQLDKPMGAQTEARHAEFDERYEQLLQVQLEPFHYGTHYSTANSVCGFLVRVMPFAQILQSMNGGSFDLPDRLFASVGHAWTSASEKSRADVRELIPEFFFLPEMFINMHQLDFGTTQAGTQVNHVALPPWAQNDPFLFVQKHREALESDHVSAHLHEWIDLIFGYKSRGPEAVAATNVFHPMSYADSVDLEGIDSALERQAAAQVVHNFGQTPAQLFSRPHPPRPPRAQPEPWQATDLLLYPSYLLQSVLPMTVAPGPVAHMIGLPESLCASTRDKIHLLDANLSLSFGYVDNSVRFFDHEDDLVAMLEHASVGRISCMVILRDVVVLGSDDGMTQLYALHLPNPHLETRAALPGHTAGVLCCAASSTWSIAVTGSADHSVIVWDLNRCRFVRQLKEPDQPIQLVAIDDQRGWIAAAAGSEVWVWSINGFLLVHQSTRSATNDPPSSMTFVARDFHVDKLGVLVTGHRDCIVMWDIVSNHARATPPRWRLEKNTVLSLRQSSKATCLYMPNTSTLCTGHEDGEVYVWTLPGAATLPKAPQEQCIGQCDHRFGFLDVKRACQGCGALICNKCSISCANGQLRLCIPCTGILGSRGMSL